MYKSVEGILTNMGNIPKQYWSNIAPILGAIGDTLSLKLSFKVLLKVLAKLLQVSLKLSLKVSLKITLEIMIDNRYKCLVRRLTESLNLIS